MYRKFGVTLVLLLLPFSTISAQMVLCDGVWTNSSCEGIAERKVGTNPDLTPDEVAAVQTESAKRSLLHDTTMRAIEARREYGIDLSLDSPQKVCRDKSTSIDACRQATEVFEDRLTKRISQELAIAKAKKEVEERPPAPPPAQTNIVIDERPIYVIKDGYYDYYRRRHPDARHHGTYSAGGAAISIRGRSSDGNLSVGIDAGATQSTHTGSNFYHPYQHRAPSVTSTAAPTSGGHDVSGLLKRAQPLKSSSTSPLPRSFNRNERSSPGQ